jgi:phage terminase large subunit-like protein
MKTQTKLRFPRLHPGQKTILFSHTRFRVVACGRRFGKTTLGERVIAGSAAKGQRCWWLSPTYPMASQVWRDLKRVCKTIDGLTVNEGERRLDFPGGGWLAIRSTHQPDHLRGAGLDLAVLDEAAFMLPEVWPAIVRPMLLERKGRALILSSPNGLNWFWDVYRLGVDPREREWRSFHYTSFDNPLIAPDELEAIRRQTLERVWRAEYLAEFVEDSGQVFRRVREAATAPMDAQPVPGRVYAAGIDWGRHIDATVVTVIDVEARQVAALDRFTQVGWELQRGRLKALCERWQPGAIWAEANSIGSVNIEALQAEGLPVRPFQTTARSKGLLIDDLALAIERGELALLADPVLLNELVSYQMEPLAGGGYRYHAPAGGHDDCVMSLALAWYGAQHGGMGIGWG